MKREKTTTPKSESKPNKDRKSLLELRAAIKKKKPDFIRQDAHKKIRVPDNWRRPRGSDSKMRVKMKGYRRCVQPGWGSPRAVKGSDSQGKMITLVSNTNQLEKLNKQTQSIIINASVGDKNRLAILKKSEEKGISIANIKEPSKVIKRIEEKYSKNLQAKKSVDKEREAKEKAKETKAKEKESKKEDKKTEDITSAEDKKEHDKKELDKILTTAQ